MEHCQRAATLMKLRKMDLAAKEVRQALQIDSQHANAHHMLASILWAQGKILAAKKEAEIALRLAPDQAEFQSTFGMLLARSRTGSIKEALEHLKRAVSLKPEDPYYHLRYALVLFLICKDLSTAWQETEVILRLDPRYLEGHLLQAEILRQQGKFSEAEKSALTVLSIDPENFNAHDLLGDIYLESHRGGKALVCYRSALRLDPTKKPLKRKIILALEARVPILGMFWKISFGLDRFRNKLLVEILLFAALVISVLSFSTGIAGSNIMVCLYCLPFLIPVGLLVWVVDPMLTRRFLNGQIKIDESIDKSPRTGINAWLGRFLKVPTLIIAIILVLICSALIFGMFPMKSP